MRYIFNLLILLIVSSCLPPETKKHTETSSPGSVPPDLTGYWEAPCSYFPGQGQNGAYKRYSVEFGDGNVHEIIEEEYADKSCVDGETNGKTASEYQIGSQLVGNIWEVDFHLLALNAGSFQIFQIIDDRLYFGEITEERDASSVEKRPININRTQFHKRRAP